MPPFELVPGERCSIRVSFAPTRPDERQARLTITVADGVAGWCQRDRQVTGAHPSATLGDKPVQNADSTDTDTTETSESETTDE